MFGILGNLFGSDEEKIGVPVVRAEDTMKAVEIPRPTSATTDPVTKRTELVYEDGGAPVTDLNVDEGAGDQAGFSPDPAEQDVKLDTSIGGVADEALTSVFGRSTIKTFNPQTGGVEDTEVPTWWRAGKGLSKGLMSYGINLLRTGDKGQAWAGAIEGAFGSLDSELAAVKKGEQFQTNLTELIKSGKYTPESVQAYAKSGGDAGRLVLEKMVMSGKEEADTKAKVVDQNLAERKYNTDLALSWAGVAIDKQNANTASFNADTQRFSAENSWKETTGEDGNTYLQAVNLKTGLATTEPVLVNSEKGQAIKAKLREEMDADELFLSDYDYTDDRINSLLENTTKLAESTQGRGVIDWTSGKMGNQTLREEDRRFIEKLVNIQTLTQMKEVFGSGVTDADLDALKSTMANVNDVNDVKAFLLKTQTGRNQRKEDAQVRKVRQQAITEGKVLRDTGKTAPSNTKPNDKFSVGGKNYVNINGKAYEVATPQKGLPTK